MLSQDLFNNELIRPTPEDKAAFERAKSNAWSKPPQHSKRLHFKFNRALDGKELAACLQASLKEQSIDPGQVLVRTFEATRLQYAFRNGTDRDRSSNVGYFGETDGEEIWMRGLGIWGSQSVTYASPINYISGGSECSALGQQNAYVLYDKNLLYKVGHASNGFHAFLTIPQQAVIGFISDQGNIDLTTLRKAGIKTKHSPV